MAIAAGVILFHMAVGYLLIVRSTLEVPLPGESLVIFEVPPIAPKPPEEKTEDAPPARTLKPAATAAAPNRHARPKPVSAPPPKIVAQVPPPIVAAPVSGTANEAAAGAIDLPGPGTGSGGEGLGTGSGMAGSGTGGGSGAKRIAGRIKDSDYPRAASRAQVGGTVVAHFDVGTEGRVSNCRVVQSSGNADLDETTCRLIEKRFRYQPATDAQGRPVPTVAGWRQDWWLEPRG